MNTGHAVFLLACLVGPGSAKPAAVFLGYQDSLGQYSFGYSAPGSARSEVRTVNGATRGAYSYVDENGIIHSTQYVADGENGFRVVASSLPEAPVPVQDTAEVIAARAAHLQAVELAKKTGESVKETSGEKETLSSETKPEENQETGEGKPEEGAPLVEAKTANVQAEEAKDEMQSVQAGAQETNEAFSVKAAQETARAGLPLAVPIYRISYRNQEVEPLLLDDRGQPNDAPSTPAGTTLKEENKQQDKQEQPMTKQAPTEPEPSDEKEQRTVYAPAHVLSLSLLPSILRYAPVHYVTYDVL